MTTRYTDGEVTVTLDDGLNRLVRSVLSAAETEIVRVLETGAEEVAQEARASWYSTTGVTRKTGASGDIQVVTTFDSAKGEVKVSVGSTDKRQAGKSGTVVPVFVHRPTATSVVDTEVSSREFYATPKPLRFFDEKTKRFFVQKSNPKASDVKQLLPVLVRAPMQAKVKSLLPELGEAIAAKARRS